MKCPYRVGVNRKIFKATDGSTVVREQIEYEECYGDSCPLFCNEGVYCARAESEGGECI